MGSELILVVGPPGTGKTSFMARKASERIDLWVELTGRPPEECTTVLIATLTRGAAIEASSRNLTIAPGQIATLHSHCWRALGRPKLIVGKKETDELNEYFLEKGHPEFVLSPQGEEGWRSISSNKGVRRGGDKLLEAYGVHRSRLIPLPLKPIPVVKFARMYDGYRKLHQLLDFHDCIAMCIENEVPAPGSPSMFIVDEAQDNDALETKLIRFWATTLSQMGGRQPRETTEATEWGGVPYLTESAKTREKSGPARGRPFEQNDSSGSLIYRGKPAGEITYIIGDPDQNLYEWRGSDSANMIDATFSDRRVLSQSYRVPRAVHAAALGVRERIRKKFDIAYSPRSVEGNARRSPYSIGGHKVDAANGQKRFNCQPLVDEIDDRRTTMFIASSDYLLADLLACLQEEGIPYWNPFNRTNGLWNPYHPPRGRSSLQRVADYLVTREDIHGEDARLWTARELWAWVEWIQAAGVLAKGAKATLKRMADHEGPPLEFSQLEEFFRRDVPFYELCANPSSIDWLNRYVMRAHASKVNRAAKIFCKHGIDGLRRKPRVIVGTIHSVKGGEADVVYVSPDLSPAFMRGFHSDPDQIHRMFYVAVTRAREELILCSPSPSTEQRAWSGGTGDGAYDWPSA